MARCALSIASDGGAQGHVRGEIERQRHRWILALVADRKRRVGRAEVSKGGQGDRCPRWQREHKYSAASR